MSKVVDQKVVEMRFDNSNFEKNVATTMSTLDKLKAKLSFKGAADGLDNVSSAVKKVDVSGLGKGVETVQAKFSALQVAGVTAMANIANSAVNAGKQLVKSFTIEPLKTGFNEYELKMGAIQTIMSATGESLQTVNAYLNELNEYSDRTIYSFSDMTQNIGKFTNAGVSLDDAVLAMKGISNEAAVSGANANEAARAMYNLAQSISMGYVQLIDWKSIENANMATVEFKQQLLDTATSLGIVAKMRDAYSTDGTKIFNMQQMFKDGLKDQWLTTDVLIQTLSNYADETTEIGKKAYAAAQDVKTFSMMMDTLKESAQSGWAQTWEIVFGNFEQGKSLWTNLSNVFGEIISRSADSRNMLFTEALQSEWATLTDAIEDAGIPLESFEKKLIEVAKTHGINLGDMIKKEGSLWKALKKVKNAKDLVVETFNKFLKIGAPVQKTTENITNSLKEFQGLVNKVIRGDFGNGKARIDAMTKAGKNYAVVQDLVNTVWKRSGYTWKNTTITMDDLQKSLGKMSNKQLENIGFTKEQISKIRELSDQVGKMSFEDFIKSMERPTGRELLIESFQNGLTALKKVIETVSQAWHDVFPPVTSERIYNIIEAINNFSAKLIMSEKTSDNLRRTLRGLFSIFGLIKDIVVKVVSAVLKPFGKTLGTVGGTILDTTANIGDIIYAFREWVNQEGKLDAALSSFVKIATKVVDKIKSIAKSIKEFIKRIYELPIVKDMLKKIREEFEELKNTFGGRFNAAVSYVKELLNVFEHLETVDLSNFSNRLKKVVELFNDTPTHIAAGLVKGFKDEFGNVITLAIEMFKQLVDKVKAFLGIHSPSTVFIAIGSFIVAGLILGMTGGIDKVNSAANGILNAILGVFKKVDWDKVVVIGGLIGMFVTINQLLKTINIFASTAKKLVSPLASVTDLIDGVKTTIVKIGKAVKFEIYAKSVEILARSVLTLAAAFVLISLVPKDKIWSSLGVLLGMVAALAGLAYAVSVLKVSDIGKVSAVLGIFAATLLGISISLKIIESIDSEKLTSCIEAIIVLLTALGVLMVTYGLLTNNTKIFDGKSDVGNTLLKMAGSLVIAALALKMVSKCSKEEIAKGLAFIAGVTVIYAGIMALSKLTGLNSAFSGVTFITLSAAILILVGVVKMLADVPPGVIAKGVAFIAAVTVLFNGVMTLSIFAGSNSAKAGAMFLMMSAAMLILVKVVKTVAEMPAKDIVKGMAFIIAVTNIFKAIMKASLFAGKNASKAGVLFLGMGVAIMLMVSSIKLLTTMSDSDIEKGIRFITRVSILFGVFVAVSKFAGENASKAGSMLLKMSLAMLILVGSVAVLSLLDEGDVARGTAAVSALMLMMAVLVAATKGCQDSLKTLVGISVVIAILTASVAVLAMLDAGKANLAVVQLIGLMTAFTIMLKCIEGMKGLDTRAMVSLIVVGGVIALLGGTLIAMAKLAPESSLNNAIALSTLLVAMVGTLKIMENMGKISPAAFVAMGVLTLIVAALGLILSKLAELPVQGCLASAIALSALLLALSGALLVASAAGSFGPQAVAIGVAAIVALVAGLSAVFAIMGDWVAGTIQKIIGRLPSMAESLSEFMVKLQPFIDGAKQIDPDVANGLSALMKSIGDIVLSNGLQNILSKFKLDSFDSLGDLLNSLADALVGFSNKISGSNITAETVKMATDAGNMVASLYNAIPKTGGGLQKIFGTQDLGLFATQMSAFGSAVVSFSNSVKGNAVSEKEVSAAVNSGKMVAELYNSLPKTGGALQKFFGDEDLTLFSMQMSIFGSAVVAFSNVVKNGKIDEGAVQAAANSGKLIADLYDSMPKTGGAWQDLFGSRDLTDFGQQLVQFGVAIATFSTTIKASGGISVETAENAANAAKVIAAFDSELPEKEGIFDKIGKFFSGGKMSIKQFGDYLCDFAKSIGKFSIEAAEKINKDGITKFKDAYSLVTAIDFTAIKITEGSADQFKSSIDKMVNAFSSIEKVKTDKIDKFIDGIVKLGTINVDTSSLSKTSESVSSSIESVVNSTSKTLSGAKSSIGDSMSKAMSSIPSEIKKYRSIAGDSIKTVVTVMCDTVKGKQKDLTSAFNKIISSASSNIKSTSNYNKFYSVGGYLSEGLISGLNSKLQAVKSAASALGQASGLAVKAGAQVHSPSRLTIPVGEFLGEGLIVGMKHMYGAVEKEGNKFGENAAGTISRAVRSINSMIDSNIDVQPTIRPVLDLSNVSAGVNNINGMLSLNPSVGVLANVRSINGSMSYGRQNGNKDVVSAINKLDRNLERPSTNTYNFGDFTYSNGTEVEDAINVLVRAARIERRK